MAGKIKKLEKIMKEICGELGIQVGVDITLTKNPARIYFIFEDTKKPEHPNYGKPAYLNTSGTKGEEVSEIADRYGIISDKSNPKDRPGNRFALGFKLKHKEK